MEAFSAFIFSGFLLVHGDAAALALGCLFGFCFLDSQGLVDPVIGGLEVLGAGGVVIALDVGALAEHEIHVGHGVVVIRTKLDSFVQGVDAFLNRGTVLYLQVFAEFFLVLIFRTQMLVGFHAQLGALFHARLVAGGPVDHANGVVGLSIVG